MVGLEIGRFYEAIYTGIPPDTEYQSYKMPPRERIPDYCHDWAKAGVLLEEMAKADGVLLDLTQADRYLCHFTHGGEPIRGHGMLFTEAIARARLAMYMEEESEGDEIAD